MIANSHLSIITKLLQIKAEQVAATIALLDAENTIPFIARYRKEATGGLDEEQLRQIEKQISRLRSLDERRETILKTIEEQGALTETLQRAIRNADTMTSMEDLYQPFKPKRRTRASIARDKGLSGLANHIQHQIRTVKTLHEIVTPYLNPEVEDIPTALEGARDIVAEVISDHAEVRGTLRQKALQWATLHIEKIDKAEDPRGVFQAYYDYHQRVNRLRPHQTLAINRGEKQKILRTRLEVPERDWRNAVTDQFQIDHHSPTAEQLLIAIEDAAQRLLLPAIERDVRRTLSDRAEEHAIDVFGDNLRALLNQPPLAGHTVLGIDPGYRTGCKVAVVDKTGKVLETETIYPHKPQSKRQESLKALQDLIRNHQVTIIAIGNGTASRETEQLTADLIKKIQQKGDLAGESPAGIQADLHYLIVNEAGASVYSASQIARKELPEMDVSMRGAVSIARRIQDPLAELVKIDPKSIGVGLYQHDVNQKKLTETLTTVVESVVNRIGVDLNTASESLLTYVVGVGPKLAEKIVGHRDETGPFQNRQALTDVSGLGPKAFEQAAGFLRVSNGDTPLDNTGVHPESYPVVEQLMEAMRDTGKTWVDRVSWESLPNLIPEYRRRFEDLAELAAWLAVGELTLVDILDELEKPGRDPRAELPQPVLRSDVLKMDDLSVGMQLQGTIRNVVDFGAFVDIGVKQDGLLHRSKIPRGKSISVGDVVAVSILKIEVERGRIGLGLSQEHET